MINVWRESWCDFMMDWTQGVRAGGEPRVQQGWGEPFPRAWVVSCEHPGRAVFPGSLYVIVHLLSYTKAPGLDSKVVRAKQSPCFIHLAHAYWNRALSMHRGQGAPFKPPQRSHVSKYWPYVYLVKGCSWTRVNWLEELLTFEDTYTWRNALLLRWSWVTL